MDIEQRFNEVRASNCDVHAHLDTMRRLGSECTRVTEFGVRSGNSTVAWLASRVPELVCYDIATPPNLAELEQLAQSAGVRFEFQLADTGKVVIDPTDLLFVDTRHCAEQVVLELAHNADRVNRYIAFHDTEIYGWIGEDGCDGINRAIIELLQRPGNPWHMVYHSKESFGFSVLERLKP